jgi:hypothetical protein
MHNLVCRLWQTVRQSSKPFLEESVYILNREPMVKLGVVAMLVTPCNAEDRGSTPLYALSTLIEGFLSFDSCA